MSTLHTVNKSPFSHTTLASCMAVCSTADAIVLLEDGVIGAMANSPCAEALDTLAEQGVKIYALLGDVQARGLTTRLSGRITPIDYPEFVQLSTSYQRVLSWY